MVDQTLNETVFLQDLQRFVREKWKGKPCDRCGTHEWSTLPGIANILRLHAYEETRDRGFYNPSTVPVDFVPLYCNNCGNTVNIYFEVFDAWRKIPRQTT